MITCTRQLCSLNLVSTKKKEKESGVRAYCDLSLQDNDNRVSERRVLRENHVGLLVIRNREIVKQLILLSFAQPMESFKSLETPLRDILVNDDIDLISKNAVEHVASECETFHVARRFYRHESLVRSLQKSRLTKRIAALQHAHFGPFFLHTHFSFFDNVERRCRIILAHYRLVLEELLID